MTYETQPYYPDADNEVAQAAEAIEAADQPVTEQYRGQMTFLFGLGNPDNGIYLDF